MKGAMSSEDHREGFLREEACLASDWGEPIGGITGCCGVNEMNISARNQPQ